MFWSSLVAVTTLHPLKQQSNIDAEYRPGSDEIHFREESVAVTMTPNEPQGQTMTLFVESKERKQTTNKQANTFRLASHMLQK